MTGVRLTSQARRSPGCPEADDDAVDDDRAEVEPETIAVLEAVAVERDAPTGIVDGRLEGQRHVLVDRVFPGVYPTVVTTDDDGRRLRLDARDGGVGIAESLGHADGESVGHFGSDVLPLDGDRRVDGSTQLRRAALDHPAGERVQGVPEREPRPESDRPAGELRRATLPESAEVHLHLEALISVLVVNPIDGGDRGDLPSGESLCVTDVDGLGDLVGDGRFDEDCRVVDAERGRRTQGSHAGVEAVPVRFDVDVFGDRREHRFAWCFDVGHDDHPVGRAVGREVGFEEAHLARVLGDGKVVLVCKGRRRVV